MEIRLKALMTCIGVAVFFCSSQNLLAGQPGSLAKGEELYGWYCASCHGAIGDGKGFNARNLDPRPTNHRDQEFMERRTDNDLADVIRGGGKKAGKSTLMPPWGKRFNESQVRSLVLYLRKLCNCNEL